MVGHIEGTSMLRMFENRVLRRVFGSGMEEVTREWRQQHNVMPVVLYGCETWLLTLREEAR